MAKVQLTYLQRIWAALTGAPEPPYVFGLEDADRLLSSPGVSAFVGGDGAVPVAIVATARFLGAEITVAEEVSAHIDAQNQMIDEAETANYKLQNELDQQILALEVAKGEAKVQTQRTVAACADEVQRAARVEQFFGPAL
jgi:hypothetical protein